MKKNNHSTIIDFGSSELRLGVFDNKLSKLFFQSKDIFQKDNFEEYKVTATDWTQCYAMGS